jgi:hypothetical protein
MGIGHPILANGIFLIALQKQPEYDSAFRIGNVWTAWTTK